MSEVVIEAVSKSYGGVVALHELDLTVREGEFLTLLGPSGCGKTTTLRLVAGFIAPSGGRILLGGEDITHLAPHRREIGMVFQDYALFPHMTIHENIVFGLKERGAARAAMDRRASDLLDLIRLPGIAKRYPAELSGGQAQRVAFARAIAHPPRVLLMDEPLGALDLKLRETMQIELRRLQRDLGITTIFVTHDQGEAMSMSDRIAVMNLGRIEQLGTPEEIYDRPRTQFVASFVGHMNMIDGTVMRVDDGLAKVVLAPEVELQVPASGAVAIGMKCVVAVRPEKVQLIEAGARPPRMTTLDGEVRERTFAGNSVRLLIDIGTARSIVIEDRPAALAAAVGARVRVGWAWEDSMILSD